jgi:hypothetical protein
MVEGFRGLIVTSFAMTPQLALAAPHVSLQASGSCPSTGELSRALLERGMVLDTEGPYVVVAETTDTGANLSLGSMSGEAILVRSFQSQDCGAMAAAMAVVVEAYFVEVVRQEAVRSRAAFDAASVPAEAPAAVLASPPPSAKKPALTPHQPKPLVAEPEASPKVQRDEGRKVDGRAFVGFGATAALPGVFVAPMVELGVGVEPRRLGVSFELTLASQLPRTQGREPDRVRVWSSYALSRVGFPLGTRPRFRPWGAVGLLMSQARASDVPDSSSQTSWSGLVGGGLETGFTISQGWRGRLELGWVVLLTRDHYRIEPEGEVDAGPRSFLTATLGLEKDGIFGW